MPRTCLFSTLFVFGFALPLAAAPPQFETDVLPILKANCVRCHGSAKKKADLDLSSHAGLLKGSETGPVIVPGKVAESKLYELIHEGEMPPAAKDRLPAAAVETIRRWIEAGAPAAATAQAEVTQHDIEPLMLLRCAACHGLRRQEAGLDLRTKASMLKGGKSGPAIVLGKPQESLVLKKIHAGEMPPNKRLLEVSVKPMAADEVERLTKWIAQGAPEADTKPDVATTEPDTLVSDKDRAFWSFQPPKPVVVPEFKSGWARNPIDAFILKKLQENGVAPSPEADRLTLLRRATIDLTGMPPEPEEVAAVLSDKSPDWYEKLIDRLLASPRYGERWGRYWLDLAGYADSEGKRSADPIRPYAYLYRDYVIRSLNSDKPYDRFLLEQLAGDELADYENVKEITLELMDNLVATGFLRLAPDGTGSDVVNFVPERLEVIADELQIFGQGVLGLTMHCARCHSHKYDPIPHRDYYRLAAVFKGAFDEHDWLKPTSVPGQTKNSGPGRTMPFVSTEARAQWEADRAHKMKEIEELRARLKAEGKPQAEADRQARFLETAYPAELRIHGLWDRGEPSPTYVYRRGDYLQPSRLVGPGVPSVLTDGKTPFAVAPPWPGAKKSGRRLALAKWLTQPDHPLTARVLVNRLWKHHFGQGIVRSLGNFGTTGDKPSHPELLDWLARDFVGQGWSMKHVHRLLLTSSTYRQASTLPATAEKQDPENRLLSHMPLRRLEAEAVYDSLLLVAGRFDETRFGPPDPVDARGDGLVTPLPTERGYRRSIYVRQRRSQVPTLLENFDLPQMNPACVERNESVVASQALHLLNNGMVAELAEAFAERVRQEAGDDSARHVERVYAIALSRPPSAEEKKITIQALAELTTRWAASLPQTERKQAEQRGLADYCHTILNSAGFLYVD